MPGPGLRDNIKVLSPPWLQTGTAEKIMYCIGLAQDVVLEKFIQGVYDRFPTLCDPSALPIIGRDRLIPQGPNESTAAYRVRLQQAFDTWLIAGNAKSIMVSLLGSLSPLTPQMRIVKDAVIGGVNAAVWDTYVAGASPSLGPSHFVSKFPTWNWQWDGVVQKWRVWLIIYSLAGSPWSIEGTWGDGDVWGDATKSWGVATPSTTFDSLRALLSLWKGASSWFIPAGGVIISFSSVYFDPSKPGDVGINPDGNWAHFGRDVAGSYIPARLTQNVAYCDGVS
jgi:hypothetical protein